MINFYKNNHAILILLAIVFSLLVTIFGLTEQNWPYVVPLREIEPIQRYIYFWIIAASSILAISILTNCRFFTSTICVGVVISFLAGEPLAFLAVALYFLASIALGYAVLRVLSIPEHLICDLYRLLVGAGIYATVVGVIAHIPINYPWLYWVGILLPIFGSRHWLYARIKTWVLFLAQHRQSMDWREWPKVALGVLCLVHFTVAFLPELGVDALAMHLLVPMRVSTSHVWSFNPEFYAWTFFGAMLADWNYTIGYLIAGETGSRLINVGFIFIIVALIKDLIFLVRKNQKSFILASLLFLSAPLTYLESSSLFVESIWTCYLLAGLYISLRIASSTEDNESFVLLLGLLMGFALATKMLSLIYIPLFLLPVLASLKKICSKKIAISFLKATTYFISLGSISYVFAYIKTGNPVFPFYNAYFESDFYPFINFRTKFISTPTWDLLYQIVFNSDNYLEGTTGSSGFQWLTLFLPAAMTILFFKSRLSLYILGVGVTAFLVLFHFQAYLRYAFPILVILCVIIGIAFALISSKNIFLARTIGSVATITLALNLLFFSAAVWPYRSIPLFEALNFTQYSLDKGSLRNAIDLVNKLNHRNAPVVFLCSATSAGLHADALYVNWYNYRFAESMRDATNVSSMQTLFSESKVAYVIVDSNWNQKDQLEMVETITEHISNFGSVDVRVFKSSAD